MQKDERMDGMMMMMQKDLFCGNGSCSVVCRRWGGNLYFFYSQMWVREVGSNLTTTRARRVLASRELRGGTGTHPYTEKAAKLSGSF